MWYCNRCKEFKQATKKFDLWTLPNILVVHLKRFSYRSKYWREKLETFVNYPTTGLDLSRHLLVPNANNENPPIYDLYAVSNHYGSMGGGHYTAYAMNKETKKWYKFDDSWTAEVNEREVVTSSAYVLFYRRRGSENLPLPPYAPSQYAPISPRNVEMLPNSPAPPTTSVSRTTYDSDSDDANYRGTIPNNYNPRNYRRQNNLSSDDESSGDISDDEGSNLISTSPAVNLGASPMDEDSEL